MPRGQKHRPPEGGGDAQLFSASDMSASDLQDELQGLEVEFQVSIRLFHFPSFGIFQAEATRPGQRLPAALACSSDKSEIVPTLRAKLEARHVPASAATQKGTVPL